MDKKFADEMIEKFQKKYFGFALAKTANIDEAQELSARIVCEAYITLRNVDNIYNWDGYLYKIASNVYAKYINERKRHQTTDLTELEIGSEDDVEHEIVKKEELDVLKKELAWLCKTHRQIIIMHYYHNKKISQISKELGIPSGTVKWHLSDAKKLMKEGMTKMRTHNLAFEPVEFSSTGHDGSPGYLGDTSTFVNSRIRKNIVYVTYREAKTIEEIAKEMGITPVYIEDEVEYLEDNGFLEKQLGNKYISTVYITDVPFEVIQKCMEIEKEIAKAVSTQYVPLLVEKFKDYKKYGITVPQDDYNYLLWSLVPYALSNVSMVNADEEKFKTREKYMLKRKDGGEYIAHATVYNEEIENNKNPHYYVCGDMTRCSSVGLLQAWSISTNIDTRENGWEDNQDADYNHLYFYLNGKLPKTDAVVEKYARLYDRGLLYNKDGVDELNIITMSIAKEEEKQYYVWDNPLVTLLPALPKSLAEFINQKCAEKVEVQKPYYPKRMHPLLEVYQQVDIDKIMVLDELVEQGVLQPLSERQQKGVFQIVFVESK